MGLISNILVAQLVFGVGGIFYCQIATAGGYCDSVSVVAMKYRSLGISVKTSEVVPELTPNQVNSWNEKPPYIIGVNVAQSMKNVTNKNFAGYGIPVAGKLVIKRGAELKEVSEAISSPADQPRVESLLKTLRSSSRTGDLEIPIEDLMGPFAQENVGGFPNEDQTNCMTTSARVAGYTGDHFSTRSAAEFSEYLERTHDQLADTEIPKLGDMLVYYQHSSATNSLQPFHTATYVLGDILLTKNGNTRFIPIVFQERSETERLYFGSKDVSPKYFRPKQSK